MHLFALYILGKTFAQVISDFTRLQPKFEWRKYISPYILGYFIGYILGQIEFKPPSNRHRLSYLSL